VTEVNRLTPSMPPEPAPDADNSQPATEEEAGRSAWGRLLGDGDFWARFGVPIALLLIAVAFTLLSDDFLSSRNLWNIARQSSVIAVAAIGATLVLISGGIDISQGAIMAFAGLTAVVGIEQFNLPTVVAVLLALVVAGAFGLINGLLAERVAIPAFIATLGTALVIRGFAFVYTEGRSIGLSGDNGDALRFLGQGFVGVAPVPVLVMALLYIVAHQVMRRSVWGLHTYAIGSSQRAAEVAGLRVKTHRTIVFGAAGLCSGLAGVLLAGRLGSAAPSLAAGAEFDILTAVVLGGTSIYGGRGSVLRTLLGAVLLATLTNGLVLLNVPSFYQPVTVGFVLLIALSMDRLRSSPT
jgi:ribose/xylose/arabinose/galactoside ABC-type transport system permease subunit